MSIHDFFACSDNYTWRQFYEFLERLPAWGHYKSQLAMDEEWAEKILDLEEAEEDHVPVPEDSYEDEDSWLTPFGYTPETARLDLIADRVLSVRTALYAVNSKDGQEKSFRPLPRPKTALDRERERRTTKLLNEYDNLIRGGGLSL